MPMSKPMTRFLLSAFCALLGAWVGWTLVAEAQVTRGIRDPGGKGGGGVDPCILPAQCQINAPVFNFGRTTMSGSAPPVYSNASISVTCTRAAVNGLRVDVLFELFGQIVNEPPRVMRDIGDSGLTVSYDMYIDPARTRLWGSGHMGSFPLQGVCQLDDRNRVCTIPFPLYGTVFGGQQLVPPGKYQGAIVSTLNYTFSGCRQ
jgi:spore coat protein U-like protein